MHWPFYEFAIRIGKKLCMKKKVRNFSQYCNYAINNCNREIPVDFGNENSS